MCEYKNLDGNKVAKSIGMTLFQRFYINVASQTQKTDFLWNLCLLFEIKEIS